ncbi:hypothetical protein NPIL_186961 [Nephila pilipes]|uniref:Uncharacterized protein n=1 Tax=Nephila pilipes TaxID=299642 RepID=A0A8X6PNT1_NEPPI|nr:hypothetical protein NPIL_186961 [Nephila pilipes]
MFRSIRGFESSRDDYFFGPNPPTLRSLLSGGEEFSVPSGNRGPFLMGPKNSLLRGKGPPVDRTSGSHTHTRKFLRSSLLPLSGFWNDAWDTPSPYKNHSAQVRR